MTARTMLLTALAATLLAGGCADRKNVRPLPGTLNSEGALLRTRDLSLGDGFVLRRRTVLISPFWNDFYPLNAASAEPTDELVSELFVRRPMGLEKIDWAHLPGEPDSAARHFSPDGRRVLYESPTMLTEDSLYPRQKEIEIRPREVAIYTRGAAAPVGFDAYNGVASLGAGGFWRKQGDLAAFTTTCRQGIPAQRSLAVVSYGGTVVADVYRVAALENLEFIGWSPSGASVAALRPHRPGEGGLGGGTLVQFDLARATVVDVGVISAEQVVEHPGRLEELVRWSDGRATVAAAIDPPSAGPLD
jgi:hypothetical protein